MRKILVPTDFSENANHAMLYAVELARLTGAELILLNVYTIYIPISDAPVLAVEPDEFENTSLVALQHAAKSLPAGIKYSLVSLAGISTNEINAYAVDNDVDVIVMGIKGATGINRFIMGSTANSVAANTVKPVIIVPEKCALSLPKSMAFAFDNKDVYPEESIALLKELSVKLQSNISVIHVTPYPEMSEHEQNIIKAAVNKTLNNLNYSLHFKVKEDAVDALNEFINEQSAGMLAMIYHKHSLFHRIFIGSLAEKMAFRTDIPLLVLPELKD